MNTTAELTPYQVLGGEAGPRDEWMTCTTQAVTEQVTDDCFRGWLMATFTQMADHMVNSQSRQTAKIVTVTAKIDSI